MFSSGLNFVFIAETHEKLFWEWSIPDCMRFCGVAMTSLEAGRQRIVYLIMYSHADVVKFPSKESFSHTVIEAWQKIGVRVLQWVVSVEGHHNSDSANGDNRNQYHYHMAVKLVLSGPL